MGLPSATSKMLQDNEKMVCLARATIVPYAPFMLGGALFLFSPMAGASLGAPWVLPAIGLIALIGGYLSWSATEIALTNSRIITKRGVIARQIAEIYLDRVEGIDVEQSVAGRILLYGTVQVNGVGTEMDPIEYIALPMRFKKAFSSSMKAPRPATA